MRYRTDSSAKSQDDVMLVAVFPMLLIRPVPDCQAAKNTPSFGASHGIHSAHIIRPRQHAHDPLPPL
jgi:hypothetical protein